MTAMANAVDRALSILAHVAEQGDGVTVRQLVTSLGLSRATCYRMLEDLTGDGWLIATDQDPPRRYRVSLRVAQMGLATLRTSRVREVALPAAIDLARVTGRVTMLAFYEAGDVVYTDAVEIFGERILPILSGVRAAAPMTGSGKVLLAFQDEAEIERVIRRGVPKLTDRTKTDPDEIRKDIMKCRELGFGLSDREYTPQTGGISVPVFGADGKVACAVGIEAPVPVRDEWVEENVGRAKSVASRASAELGYRTTRTAVALTAF